MENLINAINEVIFRQTLNVTWKRWDTPKRLMDIVETDSATGKTVKKQVWRVITDPDELITKQLGIGLAIWRLKQKIDEMRDVEKRLVWETTMSDKKRITIRKNTYSVWTLTCKRIKRDMSGVM